MNTVLLVEPRKINSVPTVLNEYHKILGDKWKYVFYCGKNTKSYWEKILGSYVEIRELDVFNFNNAAEYSYFLKQKSLWESLYGDFVLTIQDDTWIVNTEPYTIDYFMSLNKSYIGGNMVGTWNELIRDNVSFNFYNFNGGLSLRKRLDMIKIIEAFPPLFHDKSGYPVNIHYDHEDVYFTLGCFRLNLPLGDDEVCSRFAIHRIYKDAFFGIHQPTRTIHDMIIKNNKEIQEKHPTLFNKKY